MRYKSFFIFLALLLVLVPLGVLAAPGWAGNIGTATYTWDATTGALTVTGGEFTLDQWQAVIGDSNECPIKPGQVKIVTFKADAKGNNAKLTDSACNMFF